MRLSTRRAFIYGAAPARAANTVCRSQRRDKARLHTHTHTRQINYCVQARGRRKRANISSASAVRAGAPATEPFTHLSNLVKRFFLEGTGGGLWLPVAARVFHQSREAAPLISRPRDHESAAAHTRPGSSVPERDSGSEPMLDDRWDV